MCLCWGGEVLYPQLMGRLVSGQWRICESPIERTMPLCFLDVGQETRCLISLLAASLSFFFPVRKLCSELLLLLQVPVLPHLLSLSPGMSVWQYLRGLKESYRFTPTCQLALLPWRRTTVMATLVNAGRRESETKEEKNCQKVCIFSLKDTEYAGLVVSVLFLPSQNRNQPIADWTGSTVLFAG